ncbi:MAG: VPEID-CTERM sorting domain-containing protein [Gammaproteobacteria bacterium]
MDILKSLVMGAIVVLLATGSGWAAPGGKPGSNPVAPGQLTKAPELDATSGISAIALLSGIVLLMRERSRSKQSKKTRRAEGEVE